MNYIYALLLLSSIFFPLILSFDKKVHFYKSWKYLLPAISIVAVVYILFDVLLTSLNVWGFNPEYLLPFLWFGLPLEEYLFFFAIPYASIFLHECLRIYFPAIKLNNRHTKIITLSLMAATTFGIFANLDKTYTSYVFIKTFFLLTLSLLDKTEIMNRFYLTFFVILIPFVLVNGILTGSVIGEPIVWYNANDIFGYRIFTIPVEDVLYAFTLIGFGLLLQMKLIQVLSNKMQKL